MPDVKGNPYRFTLLFNQTDLRHRRAVEILNQQGKSKSQYIVTDILHYIDCNKLPVDSTSGVSVPTKPCRPDHRANGQKGSGRDGKSSCETLSCTRDAGTTGGQGTCGDCRIIGSRAQFTGRRIRLIALPNYPLNSKFPVETCHQRTGFFSLLHIQILTVDFVRKFYPVPSLIQGR